MDISTVKNLQIGYHGETIFLHKSSDDTFVLKEYIGGLSGSEYYAKVTANRIKTTIRYGRREEVDRNAYVEVFLPESCTASCSSPASTVISSLTKAGLLTVLPLRRWKVPSL